MAVCAGELQRQPYIGIEKVLEVSCRSSQQSVCVGVVSRSSMSLSCSLEVPQVIVKEIEKEVPYPEIVERIIENAARVLLQVPKIEYTETTRAAPTKYQLRTELVAVEEHVRHVPRKEVQERLFEIPRVLGRFAKPKTCATTLLRALLVPGGIPREH
eukprot:171087-Amphidinium_carterae.1